MAALGQTQAGKHPLYQKAKAKGWVSGKERGVPLTPRTKKERGRGCPGGRGGRREVGKRGCPCSEGWLGREGGEEGLRPREFNRQWDVQPTHKANRAFLRQYAVQPIH